jgi:hypothetical protein
MQKLAFLIVLALLAAPLFALPACAYGSLPDLAVRFETIQRGANYADVDITVWNLNCAAAGRSVLYGTINLPPTEIEYEIPPLRGHGSFTVRVRAFCSENEPTVIEAQAYGQFEESDYLNNHATYLPCVGGISGRAPLRHT